MRTKCIFLILIILICRWANEVQESITSENVMVQYHALGLLYHIRNMDRLALTKMLAKLTKIVSRAPLLSSPDQDHAIVIMKRTSSKELEPTVSVLQLFWSSHMLTLRFVAVRCLNNVTMTHPAAVTTCNLDLENFITDSNRPIVTLAITTLLKTRTESSHIIVI